MFHHRDGWLTGLKVPTNLPQRKKDVVESRIRGRVITDANKDRVTPSSYF